MNTGLMLHTARVKNGVAEVRAGATLLYDSDPEAEELETELKASAMLDAIDAAIENDEEVGDDVKPAAAVVGPGEGKSIILVDHEDSFVHTLGNYLRQTGAEVMTLRSGPSTLRTIQQLVDDGKKPDMVVLSPGPGSPTDFELSKTLSLLERTEFLVSEYVLAFRAWWNTSAVSLVCSDIPCTASHPPLRLRNQGSTVAGKKMMHSFISSKMLSFALCV
jgi:anthranilate synthase